MFEFKTKKPEESSSNWKPWHKDWDAITSNHSEDDAINDDGKYRYNRKGFLEDDESSDDSILIVDPGWDDYCLQELKLNRPVLLCPEARRARMDAYEKKLIQVLKIHTDDNVADLLTKAFDVSRRWTLDDMMMIWGSLYSFLRATYGVELVSAASLINTARPKLSTVRLGWCCSKVFNKGVDAWIGSKMQFGLDLRVLNGK
ncbi:hypothetical protein Tco_1461545 [Tanacetum coccineum]